MEGVVCERAFMDTGAGKSIETHTKLSQFNIVAFSLSYELDFLNVIRMLRAARIPPYSKQRKGSPLLLLGGVAAFANPLPYSPFFDIIYIGEAEKTLAELISLFKKIRQHQLFLVDASQISGIWIPSLREYTARRVLVNDLDEIETSSVCVSPFFHFKNMLLIEVERGCPFNCRFCLASQAYSPYRVKSSDVIVEEVAGTGMRPKRIGLVGAAISELPDLPQLVRRLSTFADEIGVSSLRLDRVDSELLKSLVDSGLKTMTIAPEAGSERLRYIIDKRVRDEDVFKLGDVANVLKVKRVKLYFMVGLPFEKDEDVAAITDLVREFRKTYKGELVVSVNPFVPKAHTPFQYHRMEGRRMLSRKISFVSGELRNMKHLKLITKSPRDSLLQGMLSLGDAAIGEAILGTIGKDVGWEDAFQKGRIDMDKYLSGKPTGSTLPWEFIDFGVDSTSLAQSYCKAKELAQKR
jgi:radical SAM superfamily enzyme YgiQ (UPF0313 family)